MQTLPFVKMNGAGNDFVVLDNRSGELALDAAALARLCDRHRGVGADGVLIVERPLNGHADFRMRYYNADGGEAEMCGNGARCFARFAAGLEAGGGGDSRAREWVSFETMAGVIRARIEGETVTLDMSEPHGGEDVGELTAAGQTVRALFVNTGVPHVVVPVDIADAVDVRGLGAALRYHERFAPKGTNANFYESVGPREIRLRTYERGVEDETLACGTGATAAALVHAELTGLADGPVTVRVKEGDRLVIGFQRTGPMAFKEVTLGGPAEVAFRGGVELNAKNGSEVSVGEGEGTTAKHPDFKVSPKGESLMESLLEIQIDGPEDLSQNWELYACGAKQFPPKAVH